MRKAVTVFHNETFDEYHFGVIGGPGIIVEIDETKFGKPSTKGVTGWMVAGSLVASRDCRTVKLVDGWQDICFCSFVVERRDRETLLLLIRRYIRPGSIIMSDRWAAYASIHDMGLQFEHYTVNHSENFVDPETGACTNTIKSHWQVLKRHHIPGQAYNHNILQEDTVTQLRKLLGLSRFTGPSSISTWSFGAHFTRMEGNHPPFVGNLVFEMRGFNVTMTTHSHQSGRFRFFTNLLGFCSFPIRPSNKIGGY